jgi:hypothetical protein
VMAFHDDDDLDLDFANFNLDDIEDAGFDLLPDGDYPVVVVSAEAKPHKDGHGKRVNLKLQVTDGQYRGRVLFDGLSVVHRSEKAQQIALQKVKALLKSAKATDTRLSTFPGLECLAAVKTSKQEGYEARNEVKGYKPFPAKAKPSFLGG